ncbi:MAG: DUF512 domain-containing protein [Nitrospirae bacterium]|nr:DUF512 domain-containing protein [Nitrospirota bacterium]
MKEQAVIDNVVAGSAAHKAGILKGDVIVSINGNPVQDEIDYIFYGSEPKLHIEIKRDGKTEDINLTHKESEKPGIKLRQFKLKTCKCNCIFCFVSQNPRGLRKTLYVKDEDYRLSFLYGNYITMMNLTDEDKQRIAKQRLSPLYISVHSTNRALRNRMIGNQNGTDIMKDLGFLKKHGIKMHTQIVLCPGINDKEELKKTIRELYSLYPNLQSIAVVPVGLTAHRKTKLRAVEKENAESALKIIEGFQKRFKKKHGDPIVYPADELYIKAGMTFPSIRDYGELHQLENGVGMVSLFNAKTKTITTQKIKDSNKKYITFAGTSFYPYFKRFLERLAKSGISVSLVPVKNRFFGESITVTGLITGRDVIRTLSDKTEGHDILLVPDVVLRDERDVFLDDVSLKDIESALKIKAKVIEPTPEGLIRAMEDK